MSDERSKTLMEHANVLPVKYLASKIQSIFYYVESNIDYSVPY